MTERERMTDFLAEYLKLCEKYKAYIGYDTFYVAHEIGTFEEYESGTDNPLELKASDFRFRNRRAD